MAVITPLVSLPPGLMPQAVCSGGAVLYGISSSW